MNRDKPECILMEFEEGQHWEIEDFFEEGDNVRFEKKDDFAVAYYYDHPSIIAKYDGQDCAYQMNLLYARENLPYVYNQYFNK